MVCVDAGVKAYPESASMLISRMPRTATPRMASSTATRSLAATGALAAGATLATVTDRSPGSAFGGRMPSPSDAELPQMMIHVQVAPALPAVSGHRAEDRVRRTELVRRRSAE